MTFVTMAKLLGFLAFGVTCVGYLSKDDDKLRLAVATAALMLSVHYFMMGVWVSGVSLAINFVRNQISVKKKSFALFVVFAALQIAVGIVLYKTPRDLLPVVGSLISGYALFCSSGVRFRMLMLLCTAMWFVNNLSLLSYGAMLQDGLSLGLNGIGILRIQRGSKTQGSQT